MATTPRLQFESPIAGNFSEFWARFSHSWLHPGKLFFTDRLRIGRATCSFLHNAEQCRSVEGHQRDVGRFRVDEHSVLRACRVRRLQVFSNSTFKCLFSTRERIAAANSRSCPNRSANALSEEECEVGLALRCEPPSGSGAQRTARPTLTRSTSAFSDSRAFRICLTLEFGQ